MSKAKAKKAAAELTARLVLNAIIDGEGSDCPNYKSELWRIVFRYDGTAARTRKARRA